MADYPGALHAFIDPAAKAALTRQVNALIRLVGRDLLSTDGT